MNKLVDWFQDVGWVLIVILLLVGLTSWGGWVTITDRIAREKEFMGECQKDHKKYECTAMWRRAEDHSQTVVMPVVVSR